MQPKILFLDIETAPLKSAFWKLYDEQGGTGMLIEDWYMLSWSAKWQGSDKVLYADQRHAKNVEDEKRILKQLRDLMEEAHIIVGHNIDKFDIKRINTRIEFHGLDPLIKDIDYRTVDTLKIAKKHFNFTSNSLDYIAKFLGCKNKKLKTRKYAGPTMWFEAMKQNQEAFREMELYNKQDVRTTEDVYDRLKKWDHSINFAVYNNGEHVCSCGSHELVKKGITANNSGIFQRYKCKSCSKPFKSKINQFTPEQKKLLRGIK